MTTPGPEERPRAEPDPAEALRALERLEVRLRRVEQQVRSFKELHALEVSDLANKLQTLARLHGDELELIQAELADVAAELGKLRDATRAREGGPPAEPTGSAEDPAAGSPRRARWQAEQERRVQPAPITRRELLLGRERSEAAGPEPASSG